MPVISANGARFHVQRLDPEPAAGTAAGQGPLVVCTHGLVRDNLSSFYCTLAVPVMAAGARVLLYDLRGHGRSERTPRGYTVSDGVADLCGLLDALGVRQPVHLVGNSFGGLIATRMAITAPERVAGLALIDACCAGRSGAAWLESILNTLTLYAFAMDYHPMIDRLSAGGQRKAARELMAARALLDDTSLIDDLAREQPTAPADLARIGCPVLGLFGGRSPLLAGAAELREHASAGQVRIIDDLRHTMLMDAPETVAGLVVDWLFPQAGAAAGGAR
jgi:pimeloyl-ACP methyl ester carboxylesterase